MTRAVRFVCIVSLAYLAAPTVVFAADSPSLPERKAGLWELKTVMDEGGGPREHAFKMCIGQDMEANTVRVSIADHRENCSTYDIKKDGSDTMVNASCVFNGRQVDSVTKMSGDFQSTFAVQIDSTTSNKKDGQPQTVTVKRSITQQGSYLGASCGELKPGEAQAANGEKVFVQ